jgi:RND family efflux transporter MFP subunit
VPNPDGFLTPGMFGHMRLLGSGAYDALLVPDQSVITDQNNQIVYAVEAGGDVVRKIVQVGPLIGGLRIIRSGLSATDHVIIDGVQRARPGQKVDARAGRIEAAADKSDADGAVTSPPSAAATTADSVRGMVSP